MRLTAVLLMALIAIVGVLGGILLMMRPDGGALGLSLALLPEWYTGSFFASGILLLAGFATVPIVGIVLLLTRPRIGWYAAAYIGAGLIIWSYVQVMTLGLILPAVQIAFLLVGVALVVLGLARIRAVRREAANDEEVRAAR
ncbi:hypothetical protein [Microbacterium rhizomatis]|uniref:Uncharacterized protein n=1 Tax=Microbacterium rhizomatis TaxID=1631477 RepID=A0A5J5J2G1_9MICO|nr:hypothetical protein [Microbacterium rhizomatis]KAA9107603.1 hypothetical protein F6B43_09055 [Microbacterium rhizomatis]